MDGRAAVAAGAKAVEIPHAGAASEPGVVWPKVVQVRGLFLLCQPTASAAV